MIYTKWGNARCEDCGKSFLTPLGQFGEAAYPHQDCPERKPAETKQALKEQCHKGGNDEQ